MPRSTMSALIARLHILLNNDATFTDDQLQTLLDDRAVFVDCVLTPRQPFWIQHLSPYANWEAGEVVYVGFNSVLTPTTPAAPADYTFDEQRGVATTTVADHRGLHAQGTVYDLNAAAADGWEQIAAHVYDQVDFSSHRDAVSLSQQFTHAQRQAAKYRALAWATSTTVDRADTPGSTPVQTLRDGFRQDGWNR